MLFVADTKQTRIVLEPFFDGERRQHREFPYLHDQDARDVLSSFIRINLILLPIAGVSCFTINWAYATGGVMECQRQYHAEYRKPEQTLEIIDLNQKRTRTNGALTKMSRFQCRNKSGKLPASRFLLLRRQYDWHGKLLVGSLRQPLRHQPTTVLPIGRYRSTLVDAWFLQDLRRLLESSCVLNSHQVVSG